MEHLAISVLLAMMATWRLSSLLAQEGGPFDLLSKLRYTVGVRFDEHSLPYGTNVVSRGIICRYCNSMWLGIFFWVLICISPTLGVYIAMPFAISGFVTMVLEAFNA